MPEIVIPPPVVFNTAEYVTPDTVFDTPFKLILPVV